MKITPNRRQVIGAAAAFVATGGRASGDAPVAMPGWQEALVIVPDLAPWIETLIQVGGWEVVHRGAADDALNAFWALPAGARTEQVLMRNIGVDRGFNPAGAGERGGASGDQAG